MRHAFRLFPPTCSLGVERDGDTLTIEGECPQAMFGDMMVSEFRQWAFGGFYRRSYAWFHEWFRILRAIRGDAS